jgi:hypothetical protein
MTVDVKLLILAVLCPPPPTPCSLQPAQKPWQPVRALKKRQPLHSAYLNIRVVPVEVKACN